MARSGPLAGHGTAGQRYTCPMPKLTTTVKSNFTRTINELRPDQWDRIRKRRLMGGTLIERDGEFYEQSARGEIKLTEERRKRLLEIAAQAVAGAKKTSKP